MSDSAVQVNQMDLLSGIPTILVIVAGLVQIWPSPAKVYQRHLADFVVWLKAGVEKDFCVSLYFCEKKCQTQLYDPSFDMVQKRIRINIGDIKDICCIGNSMIPAEELVEIAQRNNNGPLLIELANAVRYPKIKTLARAVTILGYAPSFGKSVIFFQWAVVIAAYTLSWLFVGGFANFLAGVFNFCHNVLRRLCGFGPVLPASSHILTPDEQMAELARHRVISEHIPWVRYGVYYLIANLAGKQPSVRVWNGDELEALKKDSLELNMALGDWDQTRGNEHSTAFDHAMINERRLIMKMASDECSAARLLYSIALHSLQTILLCNAFGYPPPHILVGSFRGVKHELNDSMVVFRHSQLDAVFGELYRWRFDGSQGAAGKGFMAHCDLLLQRLHSELLMKIAEPEPIYILINLILQHIDVGYLECAAQSNVGSSVLGKFEVNGVKIGSELAKRLCGAYLKCAEEIYDLTDEFLTSRIYWGVTSWLLYSLFKFYRQNAYLYERFGMREAIQMLQKVNLRLNLLINSPFQAIIYDEIEKANKLGSWDGVTVLEDRLLLEHVIYNVAFEQKKYCSTVPMWCACSEHCRGICTLIVNELNMTMSHAHHMRSPYAFSICSNTYSDFTPFSSDELQETFRLFCVTNRHFLLQLVSKGGCLQVFSPNDANQPKTANGDLQDNKGSGLSSLLSYISSAHCHLYQDPRVSKVEYPLSDLLYDDALQIVAILGGQLFTITPGQDKDDAEMQESLQRFLSECYEQPDDQLPEYIAREMVLKLPNIDDLTYPSAIIHGSNVPNWDQIPKKCPIPRRSIVFDPASREVTIPH